MDTVKGEIWGWLTFPFGPSSYTFFDLKVQSGRAER